jgi:hypothetical protein
MKFHEDRPYCNPEAAARKLLEIVLAKDIDFGQYTYTGVTTPRSCKRAAMSPNNLAGRDRAIAQGWFKIDTSGTRVVLLQAGALTSHLPRPADIAKENVSPKRCQIRKCLPCDLVLFLQN